MMDLPTPPGWLIDTVDVVDFGLDPIAIVEHLTNEELEWLEIKMLQMQKEIFDDMGWQHMSYELGGIEALRDLDDRLPVDCIDIRPWELIASGDADNVLLGNELLLFREQSQIIQDDYDVIKSHNGPVGWAVTTVLTWSAGSPFEGALPYRDVLNHTIEIPYLGPAMPKAWPPWEWVPAEWESFEISIPAGNIANFDDRWEWISSDMLPAYQALLEDQGAVEAIIEIPVADRADELRMLGFLPYPND